MNNNRTPFSLARDYIVALGILAIIGHFIYPQILTVHWIFLFSACSAASDGIDRLLKHQFGAGYFRLAFTIAFGLAFVLFTHA